MTIKKMTYMMNESKRNFLSKREIMDICNKLKNAQDKVLVYAVYNGIGGYKLEELRNLKYSDYDPVNEVIAVNGRHVKVDWYMKDLLEAAKKEKRYYIQNGKVVNGICESFEINAKSEYVLRGKPAINNNQGLSAMGYTGVYGRLNNVSDIVGESITSTKLYRSKIIEEMLVNKQDWKYSDVQMFLSESGIRFNASNILSAINEVIKYGIKPSSVEKRNDRVVDSIRTEKLTAYQKEVIGSLYKVVAGLQIVNETQKRKIEAIHYKINEGCELEKENRQYIDKLIALDTIYWEFIVNKEFSEREDNYSIKIYSNREVFLKNEEVYSVRYTSGEYRIVHNTICGEVRGELDAKKRDYSTEDCIDLLNWIISDFNKCNREDRALMLSNMPYGPSDIERFTPMYANDMGLDMLFAIKDLIKFEALNVSYEICEELEKESEIRRAIPCVDVSILGEVYVLIEMSTGKNAVIKIEGLGKIDLYESLGVFGRYNRLSSVKEVISELKGEKSFTHEDKIVVNEDKIEMLSKKINEINSKVVFMEDDFSMKKKENYIHYKIEKSGGALELIVSMYDCDLSITYNEDEMVYMIKKYILLNGFPLRIYDVYKERDVENLCRWVLSIKAASKENLDYSNF